MAKIVRHWTDDKGRAMVDIDDGGYIISAPAGPAGITPPPAEMQQSQVQQAPQSPAQPKASIEQLPDEDPALAAPRPQKIEPTQPPPMPMGMETVVESTVLSPSVLRERELAKRAMDLANLKASNAIDADTLAAQQEAKERQEFINQEVEQEKARQEESERLKQEQMDKYQKAADAYANTSIDSKRYWTNASATDKLMAGIGLLAGAWSYGRGTTDKNYGAEYIDRVIERDIREQEANLNKLGESVGHQRTIYQDLRQQGLDKESAAAKTRELMYNSIEAKLAGMAAASKNEAAKANLQAQMANFQQAAADSRAKYDNTVYRSATKSLEAKQKEQISEKAADEFAQAEMSIKEAHKLEDNFAKLMKQNKVGGIFKATADQVKDALGIEGDINKQETWKAYEKTLMEQRAKVFGASLTESERKSFEKSIVSWRSKPENLMNAIKTIREGTEKAYAAKRDMFAKTGRQIPPTDTQFRFLREEEKKGEKFTKSPQ